MRTKLTAWSAINAFQRCALSILFVLVIPSVRPGPAARWERVLAPAECITLLSFGVTVECTIALSGEIDAFNFTGLSGDRIRVRVVETSGALSAFHEIVRPNGVSLCGTVTGELTCQLDSNGIHTILVKDFPGPGTGNYSLYLQRLNNPVGCTAAEFGALPSSGAVNEAAASNCFTFPLSSGDRVRSRVVETAGSTSAFQEIVRPSGSTLCGTIGIETTCLADVSGSYTLLVKDFNGTNTLTYNLYVQRLTSPLNCMLLPYGGSPLHAVLGVPAETDCYNFLGFAGTTVRVRAAEATTGFSAFIEVTRPDGTTLCGTIGIEVTCDLDVLGSYTVLINDFSGPGAGEYDLSLVCLTFPCSPLQLPNILHLPMAMR